ncbi:hypothetical protein RUM43_000202 [Polyplax serrata]|uniref:Uncharacterized protein n=1 Tax=Polyplax serrata TaxID=468196 RepID=A0AAN8SCG7_POLSC
MKKPQLQQNKKSQGPKLWWFLQLRKEGTLLPLEVRPVGKKSNESYVPHSLFYCCQDESGRIKNKAEIDYMNRISCETLTKTVSLPSCVEDELGSNKDRYKSLADEMDSTFSELAGY